MSRHQANRRRTYGRRQHELHERPEQGPEWLGEVPDTSLRDLATTEEMRSMPMGDLMSRPLWRWAPGRG